MTDHLSDLILSSIRDTKGKVTSMEEIIEWIDEINRDTIVDIREISLADDTFWFFDDYDGVVLNRRRSFFSVRGARFFVDDNFLHEQPVIVQKEIGFLGIIGRVIDGTLHFLMQAKIEPGNVNYVQLSPTLQATKSNFTRAHGGVLPPYFDYFENAHRYQIIYDQIQTEQASRFYKKRNRNIIILVSEEIPVLPNFRWMTLGQLKELLKRKNLINMSSRTVLSGLPHLIEDLHADPEVRSRYLADVFLTLNNYKMLHETKSVFVPLNQLIDWRVDEYGIVSKRPAPFEIRFFDIAIEGREVSHWTQPLLKATGTGTFFLPARLYDGRMEYLIRATPEIGSFDSLELGPAIQWESTHVLDDADPVQDFSSMLLKDLPEKDVMVDIILSEEGGRFFYEQNRNLIVKIPPDALDRAILPPEYMWVDFPTLTGLVMSSNCLNIQLRNLISLIPIEDRLS